MNKQIHGFIISSCEFMKTSLQKSYLFFQESVHRLTSSPGQLGERRSRIVPPESSILNAGGQWARRTNFAGACCRLVAVWSPVPSSRVATAELWTSFLADRHHEFLLSAVRAGSFLVTNPKWKWPVIELPSPDLPQKRRER